MDDYGQGTPVWFERAPEPAGLSDADQYATNEQLCVTSEQLLSLWNRLLDRELEVAETGATEGHAYLVLRQRPPDAQAISQRDREILEKTLFGGCRKAISDDLGVTPSTLAQLLRRSLLHLGVDCSPARVPEQLVHLLHAARGYFPTSTTRLRRSAAQDDERLVLSYAFDNAWLQQLTPAESAVLRQRMAGSSYADIAKLRNTSCRTIANQVATATRRLGVSGRLELLHALFSSQRVAEEHSSRRTP